MGYGIQFVDDQALPAGHDFMFLGIPGGGLIFYRESTLSPGSLEDSWAAYRALLALDGDPDADAAREEAEGCSECGSEPSRSGFERRQHRWNHADRNHLYAVI